MASTLLCRFESCLHALTTSMVLTIDNIFCLNMSRQTPEKVGELLHRKAVSASELVVDQRCPRKRVKFLGTSEVIVFLEDIFGVLVQRGRTSGVPASLKVSGSSPELPDYWHSVWFLDKQTLDKVQVMCQW